MRYNLPACDYQYYRRKSEEAEKAMKEPRENEIEAE